MGVCCKCDDALPARCRTCPIVQPTSRGTGSELLGEHTPGRLLWIVQRIHFALWDRPGATILIPLGVLSTVSAVQCEVSVERQLWRCLSIAAIREAILNARKLHKVSEIA